jgi:hypothetical protein
MEEVVVGIDESLTSLRLRPTGIAEYVETQASGNQQEACLNFSDKI